MRTLVDFLRLNRCAGLNHVALVDESSRLAYRQLGELTQGVTNAIKLLRVCAGGELKSGSAPNQAMLEELRLTSSLSKGMRMSVNGKIVNSRLRTMDFCQT